jgi:hypothetical protein
MMIHVMIMTHFPFLSPVSSDQLSAMSCFVMPWWTKVSTEKIMILMQSGRLSDWLYLRGCYATVQAPCVAYGTVRSWVSGKSERISVNRQSIPDIYSD